MGLLIYETAEPSSAFSIGNTFNNAIAHTFDGVIGAIKIIKYFIRNDDPTFSYSNIKVQPIHINGDNIIDDSINFSWKIIVGDQEPLGEQWDIVAPANAIDIANLGTNISADISTYEPFWIRIEVPKGSFIKSHEGLKLRITATESAV